LASRGDFVGAADLLAQTVDLTPQFATAWFALGAIRDRLGDQAGAVAAFQQAGDADPADYHGARLQLARLGAGGDATPAMTETYVRRLFDQYAGRYDAALTENLRYRGPAILRDAVQRATVAAGRPLHFARALDLGCGTGLAGAAFRPLAVSLGGVDLSPAMVAQAGRKGIYDHLATADIKAFLADEIAAGARYDLVIAADVFVYVNDIASIVAAIRRVLAPQGILAFTVETHGGAGAKLLPTLRYAYGEAYLRGAIADAGLILLDLAAAAIRTEKNVPVDGLVVVAISSSSSAGKDGI
jgi:predicted TPR repeat methyltransferase